MDVLMADGVMKRLDLAINDKTGILNLSLIHICTYLTQKLYAGNPLISRICIRKMLSDISQSRCP